jgi:hypothetical protein
MAATVVTPATEDGQHQLNKNATITAIQTTVSATQAKREVAAMQLVKPGNITTHPLRQENVEGDTTADPAYLSSANATTPSEDEGTALYSKTGRDNTTALEAGVTESRSAENADESTPAPMRARQSSLATPAEQNVADSAKQKELKKKEDAAKKVAGKKEAELSKKTRHRMPMVYFQAGPSLAYQKVTPSKDDNVTITDLEAPGIFASDRLGFSAEAGFQYRVLPRLEVYGGLSYYEQRQHVRYTLVDRASGTLEGNPDEGYTITPIISRREVDYAMRNAGISAGVFYSVKAHQLEHKLGAGLLYQRGFRSTGSEGKTYTNKGSSYFQYQLSYRMEAGISDRMRLYFQPSFIYAFSAHEKLDEPVSLKPYRAGISVGILYNLKSPKPKNGTDKRTRK